MALAKTFIGSVGNGGTASVLTLPSYNQPAGELIVLFSGINTAGPVGEYAPTDTAGNTYIPLLTPPGYAVGPYGHQIQVWYCENCLGNATNVIQQNSYSPTWNNYAGFVGWHVSGAVLSGSADTSSTAYVGVDGSFNGSSGAYTTSQANEVLFSVVQRQNAGNAVRVPQVGWDDDTAGLSVMLSAASQIVSAIQTTQTMTWNTIADNTNIGIVVVTFKAVSVPTQHLIQLVQHASTDNGETSSSTVVTVLDGVAKGNLLTCSVTFGNEGGTAVSVSDNVNGAWSVASAVHFNAVMGQTTAQFYFPNSAAGDITITATAAAGAAAYAAMNCQEWSGAATSSPLDQSAQQDGTTANASSGSVTTLHDGELILGDVENLNGPTAGSGFSRIDFATNAWLSTEYKIQASAGAVVADWTSAVGNWTAQVATFKAALFAISGSAGVAGATVSYTGTASGSVTADGSGNFSIPALANGAYTITPSKTGYIFSPTTHSETVSGADITGVNFTAAATHSISGTTSIYNVTVTLSGDASASVSTDNDGNYSFTGLLDGSYVVTPTMVGRTFAPTTHSEIVSGSNITGVNFVGALILVATPTFLPVAGSYGPAQLVALSCTDSGLAGFAMWVTDDGNTPTPGTDAQSYEGHYVSTYGGIPVASTRTLKVIATATNFANSATASALYTINGAVSTPTFLPVAGAFGPTQNVSILDTDNALSGFQIYYTTNGDTPDNTKTAYTYGTTVPISASHTLKAIAYATNYSTSAVGSAAYTINGAVATPSFSPSTEAHDPGVTVTVTCSDFGLTGFGMRYTTDGTTPTESHGTVLASGGTVVINATDTLKAIAYATNYSDSAVRSADYTITFTLSGNAGITGATVTLTGTSSASMISGSDGSYSFAGLPAGSYTITPSLAGYAFSPASAFEATSGSDISGVNFTATVAYSISGSVGIAGATVACTGQASTVSASDGTYSFAGLVDGSYTITPSLAGYTFSPASTVEVVSGADITDASFTATANPTPPTPSGSGYSVPDCRVAPFGPNTGVIVQGTVQYTGQTSSNPAIPPTDSRAAGAPVDSRLTANKPQNSRTLGTFGPGE